MEEKSDFIKNLDLIYQDLLSIEIKADDSFISMLNKFYDVMRKWKICQGTWSTDGKGRICNNSEWSMCYEVFKAHKILSLDLWLALNTPPEDLLAYGKRTKLK